MIKFFGNFYLNLRKNLNLNKNSEDHSLWKTITFNFPQPDFMLVVQECNACGLI